MGPWIQTYNGRQVYPLAPEPAQIDIHDIAHALANLCRFTGHSRRFYSVAQHSVLVARECPDEYAAWGLMHDAAEAYINDIARPLKQNTWLVDGADTPARIEAVEQRILEAISVRFVLPWPVGEECERAIKEIDTRLLLTEKRDLMAAEPAPWSVEGEPFDFRIEPWTPEQAEREFLSAALEYRIVPAVGVPPQDVPDERPILEEAAEITSVERRQAYGHPVDNFRRIAATWAMVFEDKLREGESVTAQDVAMCMIGLKLARERHAHKRDNLVDIAGYARTLAVVEGDE